MESRIPTNATITEIAFSLNKSLKEIDGKHKEINDTILFKFARVKFCEGLLDEAQSLFSQCNIYTIDHYLPENYEIYYWNGRIKEAKGNMPDALVAYKIALARCDDRPNLIPRKEIVQSIISLSNLTGTECSLELNPGVLNPPQNDGSVLNRVREMLRKNKDENFHYIK